MRPPTMYYGPRVEANKFLKQTANMPFAKTNCHFACKIRKKNKNIFEVVTISFTWNTGRDLARIRTACYLSCSTVQPESASCLSRPSGPCKWARPTIITPEISHRGTENTENTKKCTEFLNPLCPPWALCLR